MLYKKCAFGNTFLQNKLSRVLFIDMAVMIVHEYVIMAIGEVHGLRITQ